MSTPAPAGRTSSPSVPRRGRGGGAGAGPGLRPWQLVVALLLLAVASVVSLGVGVMDLRPGHLLQPTTEQWELIRISRLPRLVAVLLAGAALSVAGLIMQRITQNRFVSPSTSGTVESAVLGILVATLLFASAPLVIKMIIAVVTSLLGTLVFLRLLQHVRHNDGVVVALVGLMYGGVITAVTTFIAFQLDLLQMLDVWTTGSFAQVLQGRYEPLYVVLAAGVVGYLFADRFTVVGLGEELATNLGVSYRFVLYLGLVIVSVMAAVVVVVVGAIPFLGLIVPNVVSLLMGDNVRAVLPVTALAGAGFVLVCDVVGRLLIFPYEIPVSTIAGVVGGVIFVVLILRAAGSRTGAGSSP